MKTLTTENFIEKAKEIHVGKYDYSKVEYINSKTKVCIICPEHGEFWQVPNYHLDGCGCPKCGEENRKEKKVLSLLDFIKRSREIHGDKYDYSKVEYKGIYEKICIICPEHGEFWQIPNNHINNKKGCPKCGVEKIWNKRGRITTENFIEKAKGVHKDKYDYSKVEYINSKTKVCIICPEHGEFWQTPSKHLSGQGCPKCGIEKIWNKRERVNTDDFIKHSHEVHGDRYDYSKAIFKRKDIKVCIICPEHGEFYQTPSKHLSGQGCPKCVGKNKNTVDIIGNFKKIHGDKYDYSKVEYDGAKNKICIICHEKDKFGNEHGEFWQTPSNHLNGKNCPKCANEHNMYEMKLYKILSENFPNEEIIYQYKNKKILGLKSLDIFFKNQQIGIEYQGRQHFIPVSKFGGEEGFKNVIDRDIKKFQECNENGIKILYFTYSKKEIPIDYFSEVISDINVLIERIKFLIKQ